MFNLDEIRNSILGEVQKVGQGIQQAASNVYNYKAQGGQSLHDQVNAVTQNPANLNNYNLYHQLAQGNMHTGSIPLDTAGQMAGQFVQNKLINPAYNAVNETRQVFAPNQTLLQRGGHALNAGINAFQETPGMIAWNSTIQPTIDATKNTIYAARKGQNIASAVGGGLTGQKTTGLGNALTDNPALATVGNIAEFPLTLLAGNPKALANGAKGAAEKFTTQYSKRMASQDISDAVNAIERWHFNKEDLNYAIGQGQKDEQFIRQMAADYIDKKLAAKGDIKVVAQELLNRIRVDQHHPQISLGFAGKDQTSGAAQDINGTLPSESTPQPNLTTESPLSPNQRIDQLQQQLADASTTSYNPSIAQDSSLLFHGTSSPIPSLKNDIYTSENYYGQGFYTTDSKNIAQGYSNKGKGGVPTIYNVEPKNGVKLFDAEKVLSPEEKILISKVLPVEYKSMLDGNVSLRKVYDEIRDTNIQEGYPADEAQLIFNEVSHLLMKQGYEGLQHTGGKLTGNPPHIVKIFWNPESDVKIQPLNTNHGISPAETYNGSGQVQVGGDALDRQILDTPQISTQQPNPLTNNPSLIEGNGSQAMRPTETLSGQPELPTLKPSIAPQELNVNRLDLNAEQKAHVQSLESKDVKQVLSNKEIVELAQKAGFDTKSHSIDETATKIAEQLNTRRQVVELEKQFTQMQQAGAPEEELQKIVSQLAEKSRTVREARTEAGRVLQAGNILANDINTPMQKIFQLLDAAGVNSDVYLKEATKVNFNDANQAVAFYRKFVPAKWSEYLDTIRYNSMLSSPNTHIGNAFSNLLNGGVVAPIEKTLTGTIDFLNPVRIARGEKQTQFAGEGAAFAKGYISSLHDAAHKFAQSLRGETITENLDMQHLPLATGKLGKSLDRFSLPTKLLEASDQFFTALTEGGEKAALKYRQSKGVNVGNIEGAAKANAQYRLFRSDLHDPRQGTLLNGIDEITGLIQRARSSKNPIVSTISKFTLPFVKTPMNILKQGVEYSPAGVLTMPGAANKTEQLSKAILGTANMAATAMLTASGRTTWAEPTDEKKRAAFRAAGMQPYSVKIGDNWVSYQKLPPAIGFPIAFVAAIHDAQENHLMTDSQTDDILNAVAKVGNFFADQSYLKNIGDIVAAAKGSPENMSNFVSNYPQQLVPYRALFGWMARITDPYQRKVDKNASFWDQQVQQLFTQVPFLSQSVPARMDNLGNPIQNQHPILNSISPLRVTTENPDQRFNYDLLQQKTMITRNKNALMDQIKQGKDVNAFMVQAAEENPINPKIRLQNQATKSLLETEVNTTGQPKVFNNTLIYPTDSGTGTIDLTPAPNKKKDSSEYLKWEGDAYSSADKILGLKIPQDQKLQYIKQLGLDPNNVTYYDNASQSEDVKTAFVKEHLSSINDHGEMLKQLVQYRQEIKGKMVLTNEVIDNLVDEELISKEEGKQLKSVKLDENKTPHTKITGRGKGARIKSISTAPIKLRSTKMPRVKLRSSVPRLAIPNVNFSTPFDPRVTAPQVPNFSNLIKVKF